MSHTRLGLAVAVLLALGACAAVSDSPAPRVDPIAAMPPPPPAPPPTADAAEPPRSRVVVRTVKVACVPRELPRAPRYPDTDQALKQAGGAADRYQLLAAGRLLREQRLALLEKVVAGCR
jgi:hypothetical protein